MLHSWFGIIAAEYFVWPSYNAVNKQDESMNEIEKEIIPFYLIRIVSDLFGSSKSYFTNMTWIKL
jgi:hypothetical protein